MSQNKKCSFCGTENEENVKFCVSCGGAFATQQNVQPTTVITSPEIPKKDNIFIGLVGALLFSLIGAAAYFGVYQLGYIAGICGFLMYWLASFGYDLFNGRKKVMSTQRIVISVIVMLVMIFVAEWACLGFDIMNAFKELGVPGVGFFEGIELIPTFMEDSEFSKAVAGEFAMAYGFGILAIVGEIINFVKAKKAANSQNKNV